MNLVGRWRARRHIGRVAVAALLANELEYGDLRDRILTYLDDHGADQVLREAVTQELSRFRRTVVNGMKEAQLIDLCDGRLFFEKIEAGDKRAELLLSHSTTGERSANCSGPQNSGCRKAV